MLGQGLDGLGQACVGPALARLRLGGYVPGQPVHSLGDALLASGNPVAAAKFYNIVVGQYPDSALAPDAQYSLAICLEKEGKLAAAAAADYSAIHCFLTAVFQRPTREEFRTSLEDPYHEPHDRLLAKCGSRIVGHVHLTRRVMQFGSLDLPVAGLHGLGVLPEFRGGGCGGDLLAAAEARMAADGALVGLLWTRSPHFFRNQGWALCCRHCRAGATARDLLAGLEGMGLHRRKGRLNIRHWRRMELGALAPDEPEADEEIGRASGRERG